MASQVSWEGFELFSKWCWGYLLLVLISYHGWKNQDELNMEI